MINFMKPKSERRCIVYCKGTAEFKKKRRRRKRRALFKVPCRPPVETLVGSYFEKKLAKQDSRIYLDLKYGSELLDGLYRNTR